MLVVGFERGCSRLEVVVAAGAGVSGDVLKLISLYLKPQPVVIDKKAKFSFSFFNFYSELHFDIFPFLGSNSKI